MLSLIYSQFSKTFWYETTLKTKSDKSQSDCFLTKKNIKSLGLVSIFFSLPKKLGSVTEFCSIDIEIAKTNEKKQDYRVPHDQ